MSLRENKSFGGAPRARAASRCLSRSRHGWAAAVPSVKRDTMSVAERKCVICGLFSGPNISACLCLSACLTCVDGNTGETIGLDYAKFILPRFILDPASEPIISRAALASRHERLTQGA